MFELCPVTSFTAGAQIWPIIPAWPQKCYCLVNNIFDVRIMIWYVTIHGRMSVLECKTSVL